MGAERRVSTILEGLRAVFIRRAAGGGTFSMAGLPANARRKTGHWQGTAERLSELQSQSKFKNAWIKCTGYLTKVSSAKSSLNTA